VRADQAKARYEDGMLRVELPLVRSEPHPRSVPIENSE
jgi:HSP20 family molecular chaperone IbpA